MNPIIQKLVRDALTRNLFLSNFREKQGFIK